tara:strand:- start:1107 stop:1748 length:642 start_codon:yes stop_codon:yes gene_type:complete
MKTMGFANLYLVNPKCEINDISFAMASNAKDILENAEVSDSLAETLSDCNYIIGATARQRDIPLEIINPREFSKKLSTENFGKVAILLGNEARGLTNKQLAMCSIGLHIPSNKKYTSLNLAASLQIILYELMYESKNEASYINKIDKNDIATNEKLTNLFIHMDKVLKDINFIKDDRPMISRKINYIFKKASLSEEEINILRGILSAIENHSQ